MNAELVWDVRATLGEGVVWLAGEQRLYFVDIKNPAIHAYEPASGARHSWPMPEMIGWLVPRARGGWIAGMKSGVAALTLDGPPDLQWIHRLHGPDSPLRLNDARADASGCLWFGTMNNDDETQAEGSLYRLDPDGSLHKVDDGYCVSNGPCFAPDGRTLYHTDSARRVIYAFDVGADRALSNKRVWKRIVGPEQPGPGAGQTVEQNEQVEGFPDGMCTDSAGYLWVARWGGACVTRLDPDGNEVLRIHTHAPHTTNCCFGGPQLTDLYISSARIGLAAERLAAAPASGALFVARAAGLGAATCVFGG